MITGLGRRVIIRIDPNLSFALNSKYLRSSLRAPRLYPPSRRTQDLGLGFHLAQVLGVSTPAGVQSTWCIYSVQIHNVSRGDCLDRLLRLCPVWGDPTVVDLTARHPRSPTRQAFYS